MKRQHPNVAKLELVAHALGALREQLVFVGGCAVDLLLTDPAAAPARVTYDVGLVARVEAPAFMATKFEAFFDRGRGDVLGSHDLEDIVNVVDGRPELAAEVASAVPELRQYLAGQCRALLAIPGFMNALPGMVFPDESLAERVKLLALRFEQIGKSDQA
ncbi:hypothetical protein [Thiobacillus sp.]